MRQKIIEIALSKLGCKDPSEFWRDVLVPPEDDPRDAAGHKLSWCGAFVLWVLRTAELCGWKWSVGKGFLSDGKGGWKLPVVARPKPACIAYLAKNQHYCIVERVEGSVVHTIDGNSGKSGGEVVRNQRPVSSFAAFWDTEPLFPKA